MCVLDYFSTITRNEINFIKFVLFGILPHQAQMLLDFNFRVKVTVVIFEDFIYLKDHIFQIEVSEN